MTLSDLARHLGPAGEDLRWRLVAEFLEEYRWEPQEVRPVLLREEPEPVGDPRWDVFLAALGEHLAAQEGASAPGWCDGRELATFWFPFNTPAARADALVHAPTAFRRRGIFVAPQELQVA